MRTGKDYETHSRPRITIRDLTAGFPTLRTPVRELTAAILVVILLVTLCLTIMVVVLAWVLWPPDCDDLTPLLADQNHNWSLDEVETACTSRRERRLTELITILKTVASVLVPLFTLLAGYLFGKTQAGLD